MLQRHARHSMRYPILIGTYGWNYSQWCGSFYDADLPEDWRLSWYANHFRSVIIPVGLTDSISTDQIDQWREDTDADFRFILEIGWDLSGFDPAALSKIEAQFKGQLEAVIFRSEKGAPIDWASLERARNELAVAIFCLDILSEDPPDGRYGRCHDVNDGDGTGPSPYTVVYFPDGDLAKIRSALERMKSRRDQKQALIFTHPTRAFEDARQARIIADLLGVS